MKGKNVFRCQQCGKSHGKWAGRCDDCGAWNSLVEEKPPAKRSASPTGGPPTEARSIVDVASDEVARVGSVMGELDTVLGGGLVPGSVVLLGGEPGIGKSTLLLQAAASYASTGTRVLYVSGEESSSQIALRASRLKITDKELFILTETRLTPIFEEIERLRPRILVLDSIQTVASAELDSQPGSVAQLRECCNEIVGWAKARNMGTFLVGHVTKEGAIAGPKLLEHMVDVVLYFDGNNVHSFRLLRSIKNRFGSTNEIGVFEMTGEGMRGVNNPSDLFLSERSLSAPGSAVAASLEGNRPLLIEVQGLVSYSTLAIPRRTAIGVDPNRLALLTAILEKRGGYRLGDQDVYVNLAGGLKLNEPAIDLAVLAAIISSTTGRPVDNKAVFCGEVGLGGEIRSIPRAEARLKEGARVGFQRAFVPTRVKKELGSDSPLELVAVEHVGQLSDFL